MIRGRRLRTLGLLTTGLTFICGVVATWLWLSSKQNWQDHLTRAYVTGISIDAALRNDVPAPPGIVIRAVSPKDQQLLRTGEYLRLQDIPKPAFVTNVSLRDTAFDPLSGRSLSLVILSDKLRYPVADIASAPGETVAAKLGNVTRLLATYCSEPALYARISGGQWQRISGSAVWSCAAAPRDMRLAAFLFAVLALTALGTVLLDTVSHFDRFARALKNRTRLGGPESYSTKGPAELAAIVAAVNSYLEDEREQLRKRAAVLSGVSHDLGTPATRLRLRSALIPEPDLRAKFEADIDSMTGIIESVLTYTRAELASEEPRKISLLSLVQSIVDDYRDTGRPVALRDAQRSTAASGTIFSAKHGNVGLPDKLGVLVMARPVSLQRAISNLIENALKYGRRATVEVIADAHTATVVVEDESVEMSPNDIAQMTAPFKRGENASAISGFGLGLTIVETVAKQHGGELRFENGPAGLRACLHMARRAE